MLDQVAREAAERFGDDIAYVAPDGWSLTYRELDRYADEVGRRVWRSKASARATSSRSCCPQLPEYFVLYIAAAKLGAITAGVNTRLSPRRARRRAS